jgi:transcription initiation factor TFIIIB Brf1 subunit/transcription initiation factor TFIIB
MSCKHHQSEKIIFDAHEGTHVCTECNRVISENVALTEESYSYSATPNVNETLNRVLDKFACGDQSHIIKQTENHFNVIRGIFPGRELEEIAVYAIFVTLNKECVPRSFSEISFLTGVCEKKLFQLHTVYSSIEKIEVSKPENYLHRACAKLGLPLCLEKKIFTNILALPTWTGSYSPKTVLATCIHSVCQTEATPTTLQEVSAVCCVNEKSVRGLEKKLDKRRSAEQVSNKKFPI